MAINSKEFMALQPGVNELMRISGDIGKQFVEGQQKQASDNREADLKKYLQGNSPAIAGQEQAAKNEANLSTLGNPKLKEYLQPGGSIGVGDIKVGRELNQAKPMLTPAQESAEKEAGKKIAEFEGGGRQSAEGNIGQIQGVQQDLQQGKRDNWDKRVGGALENHPTLMAMFSPAEKARRDAVQNAMLGMLHEAGIPRPTQWDIQRVFGQVYDPASDDKTNLARLQQAISKISGHKQAMESATNQYNKTGYATIGNPSPQPQAQPQGFNPDAFLKGQ